MGTLEVDQALSVPGVPTVPMSPARCSVGHGCVLSPTIKLHLSLDSLSRYIYPAYHDPVRKVFEAFDVGVPS